MEELHPECKECVFKQCANRAYYARPNGCPFKEEKK